MYMYMYIIVYPPNTPAFGESNTMSTKGSA